jgi:hypothetical protein
MNQPFGKSNRRKKNPIRNSPLPNPGTSLRNEAERIAYEIILPWIVLATFSVMFAVWEWLQFFGLFNIHPWFVSTISLGICAIAVVQVIRLNPGLRRIRLARQGEIYVGQLLEQKLRPLGYQVYHDVQDRDFNIDHVLIGPGGVFAVETKTISKSRADSRVTFSDSRMLVDGRELDRDPVVQATAEARTIARILCEYSGATWEVKGVVLFPNWYVDRQPKQLDVWVLNEKAFISFIAHETRKLSVEQINQLSAAIERYIRDQKK